MTPSAVLPMHPAPQNIPRFLSSWATQLHSPADQVRDLIGSRHWLSDGHHKERLLSEFIAAHLPEICTLSTGFVFPILSPSKVSREIDILVTDKLRATPLLTSGNLIITPPEGIIAHIHVKSKLTSASFRDNVETALSVSETVSPYERPLPVACLFFFESSLNLNERFFASTKAQLAKLADPARGSGLIMCAGKDIFGVCKPRVEATPARLVLFKLEQLAAGAFVANLLNSVETYYSGTSKRHDLLQAIASLAPAPFAVINL